MNYIIKELRSKTGLSQREFAEKYEIPISTLRKWEQGEARPATYFVRLLARYITAVPNDCVLIEGAENKKYYYNQIEKSITDMFGNKIFIKEDLTDVKKKNLSLYVDDMFETFYEIQEKFDSDCRFDKQEDIIWS